SLAGAGPFGSLSRIRKEVMWDAQEQALSSCGCNFVRVLGTGLPGRQVSFAGARTNGSASGRRLRIESHGGALAPDRRGSAELSTCEGLHLSVCKARGSQRTAPTGKSHRDEGADSAV